MAHKTSIGGTAYDIGGGKTLVEGTSYSVKNGKVLIDGTEYDISFLLPAGVLDLWSGSNSCINCITYADGYWVVGGLCYDGAYCARIAYATSLDGDWATKDLWSANYSNTSINCITYADGYWVVGGGIRTASSNSVARIAYATSPDGDWTIKNVWSVPSGAAFINCITYANGYWVVGGVYYLTSKYYACIGYVISLDYGWTVKQIWNGSSTSSINCITYANGYWVVGGLCYDGSYYARIAYASNLEELGNTE